MASYTIAQDYSQYGVEDHATWATLCERQSKLGRDEVSDQFLDGLAKLQFDNRKVVDIGEVSELLRSIAGWTLVPVTGLIPTKDFFYLLVHKKYPVTVSIRKPHELEFSEQPDIFHDVFGHLPLLTNRRFTQFLTGYAMIALKYIKQDLAIEFLGRLYWYTYEMGLIREEGRCKAYGGAIITSSMERTNVADGGIPKYPFTLDQVFTTPYNPYKLQHEYFVIESFDELFQTTRKLEEKLAFHLAGSTACSPF